VRYFILSLFGKDRPGIVANVSRVLYELGLNIEDSSMTRLGNEFVIMLVLSSGKTISVDDILKALEKVQTEFELSVTCKPIPEDQALTKPQKLFLYRIVVFGSDKPGIVYHVSNLLANYNVNIYDLRTQKSGDIYVMFIECESKEDVYENLKRDLDSLKNKLKVDISIEPQEVTEL